MLGRALGCSPGDGLVSCIDAAWATSLLAAGLPPPHHALLREAVWPLLSLAGVLCAAAGVAALTALRSGSVIGGIVHQLSTIEPSRQRQGVRQVFLVGIGVVYIMAFASIYVQLPVRYTVGARCIGMMGIRGRCLPGVDHWLSWLASAYCPG